MAGLNRSSTSMWASTTSRALTSRARIAAASSVAERVVADVGATATAMPGSSRIGPRVAPALALSLRRPILENHQRDLAVRALLILGVAAVGVYHSRPQARALFGRGHPRPNGPALGAELHRRVGICPQVVEPGRMPRIAALRGDEHHVVAVLDVQQGGRPLDPALRPHVIEQQHRDRKSTRLNSSHITISYAVFCLKKKKKK